MYSLLQLDFPSAPKRNRRFEVFVVHPLMLQVPEQAYFVRSPTPPPPRKNAPKQARVKKSPAPSLPPAPKLSASFAAAPLPFQPHSPDTPPPPEKHIRKFELPPVPQAPKAAQTVLLPEAPVNPHPSQAPLLPAMIVWAQPILRRPQPKRYVAPGRIEAPAQTPALEAPPVLAAPSLENASIKLPPTNFEIRKPALVVHSGGGNPIRIYRPSERPRNESVIADLPGTPVNLLSLDSENGKWNEKIELPPLIQMAGQIGTPPPSGNGAGMNRPRDRGTLDPVPPSASARVADGEASRGTAAKTTHSSTVEGLSLRAQPPIRTVHPNNGVYDVVIQSSPSDVLPEGAGYLSGRPVYTVYLPVGARKSWILQYCTPNSSATKGESTQQVVRLGNPAPLKAPYPIVSVSFDRIPRFNSRYLLLHGYINSRGAFENLRMIKGGEKDVATALLASLNRWEFRPATLDGQPLAVEVLLGVPTE
ncbi:MAG: hypothetical protein HY820_33205 [Acidobacteria bacterium]|nr:hypothetical protein [Acidobacteriota bacterium]